MEGSGWCGGKVVATSTIDFGFVHPTTCHPTTSKATHHPETPGHILPVVYPSICRPQDRSIHAT